MQRNARAQKKLCIPPAKKVILFSNQTFRLQKFRKQLLSPRGRIAIIRNAKRLRFKIHPDANAGKVTEVEIFEFRGQIAYLCDLDGQITTKIEKCQN